MTTLLTASPGHPMQTITEVSCPDRERITTTFGGNTFQIIRIGRAAFVNQGAPEWTKLDVPAGDWSPCGASLGEPAPWAIGNEGRDMTTILATMARNAQFVRAGAFVIEGQRCQRWQITMLHPGNAEAGRNKGITYTFCIGDHHFPREIAIFGGGYTTIYSDWNAHIDIQPPVSVRQTTDTPPAPTH